MSEEELQGGKTPISHINNKYITLDNKIGQVR